MLAVITRILIVFSCFFLSVYGRDTYQVTVPFNATVTMNCTTASVIQILNITVNENSKCTPMDCILSEEHTNTTKALCDEQHACNITSNIPNSCLLDLGYINYTYTCTVQTYTLFEWLLIPNTEKRWPRDVLVCIITVGGNCKDTIAYSCNFDRGWCSWIYSPQDDDEFRWQLEDGSTNSDHTGPSKDHTSGSGYYAYTEASKGNDGNVATLESVEITSSSNQCLSFWYHMRGRDIGSLLVYQIYPNEYGNIPIWTQTGAKGTKWIYKAINLIYKIGNFKIKFEGIRGDGSKGDIALDDITIRNNNCKDFSSRCQQSDSGQCRINSNEETSSELEKSCKNVQEPISLSSCSNKYLTIQSDGITFDPEFDFCNDTYMKAKQSFCKNTDESDICTADFYWIIQSNPECFSRYSMTIDYTCEENAKKSRSRLKSEYSNLTGIAVGVSLGCGMVASVIILIIFLIRRSDKNKSDGSSHQKNTYVGNQGVGLPQQKEQKVDKIELIGDISVDQHLYNVTYKSPLHVTDDEYTYIDSMDNPADKGTTGDSEYALIDQSNKNRGLVNTSGKSSIENCVVLDLNKTGFNRHLKMTAEHDKCSNKPAKNRLRNDITKPTASPYEMATEGTYDSAGLHAVNGNAIYNHTVDDVYDASSHKRQEGNREDDTYDHVLGRKTDDDYDIMTCT